MGREKGMSSTVVASRSAISLGHILQWPGIQRKDSWAKPDRQRKRTRLCPHSIRGKEVRGRAQEREEGIGICKDR